MNIGEELKKKRVAKNVSVYKLAKISDVSPNHIHCIERGESQPSIATLERLLAAMGSNITEFFHKDEGVIYPSELEYELITELRRLDDIQQKSLLQLIKTMK